MKVRELISNARDFIGVNTPGIENIGGQDFKRDLRQLQLLVSTLRQDYPFRVTQIFTYAQITNPADVDFINIETITSSLNFSTGPNYPMEEVSLEEYNYLTVIPYMGGIPLWYYVQEPSTVMIWQPNNTYSFRVTGKINNAVGLTADTELDPLPLFFQDYIEKKLGERLLVPYKKSLTPEMKNQISLVEESLMVNTQSTTAIDVQNDCGAWVRPKYFVNNIGSL